MIGKLFAALTAICLTATPVWAETVDLTGLPPGDLGTAAAAGGVTFDSTTNLVNMSDQYFTATGGAICASKGTSTNNCRGAYNIRFGGKVSRINLSAAGYQPGDGVSLVMYRGKTVIGVSGASWNGKLDLSNFRRITRIKVTYDGVGDGMALGKLSFTRVAALGGKHGKKPEGKPATH